MADDKKADQGAQGDQGKAGEGAGAGEGTPYRVFKTADELQDELNAAEAKGRQMAERRLQAQGLTPEEKVELDRLRKSALDRDRADAEERRQYDRALESVRSEHSAKEKSWQERETQLMKDLTADRCAGRIISAASGKAVSPEQVAILLANRVQLDEHRQTVVLDEQGKPWYIAGRNATVVELVEDYLRRNKHLAVPGAVGTGGGGGAAAGDGAGGATPEDAEIKKLEQTLADAQEVARKSGSTTDIANAHIVKTRLDKARKAKAA